MVRSLRQRHRLVILALSALVPAAFVLGITSRRAVPVLPLLPNSFSHESTRTYQSAWDRNDLWEKEQLRTRLLKNSTDSNLALEVTAPEPIVRPDVLLYWMAGNPNINDSLPNDVILLGAWIQPAKSVELPQAVKGEGKLFLYSLADHEILNVSKAFSIQ